MPNGPSGAVSLRPTKRTGRSTASLIANAAKIGASANRRAFTTMSAPLRRGRCWSPPTLTFQRSWDERDHLTDEAGVAAPVVDDACRFVDEAAREFQDASHRAPSGPMLMRPPPAPVGG